MAAARWWAAVRRGRASCARCRRGAGRRALSSSGFGGLDEAGRITLVGACVNVGLGGCKVGVGSCLGSPALIADGAHSLSDVATDAVAYASYAAARAPPDEGHPFGHGKYEAGGSAVVGLALVAAGAGACHHSILTALEPAPEVLQLPEVAACAGVAAASIVAKEWLYRATSHVGATTGSDVLKANAVHHRSDAWSSFAALGGILGAYGFGIAAIDPTAGAFVGAAVSYQGLAVVRRAGDELVDASLDSRKVRRLEAAVSRAAPPRARFALRARKSGPGLVCDLVLRVDRGLSASAAHQIGEHAKVALVREAAAMDLGVADVYVHLDPVDRQESDAVRELAEMPHALERRIRARAKRLPEVLDVTHVLLSYEGPRTTAKVDVLLPDDLTIRAAHGVAFDLRRNLLRTVPQLDDVDVDCELDEKQPPHRRRDASRFRRRRGKRRRPYKH